MAEEQVDVNAVLDEVKAQRNAVADQLAMTGALILKLRAKIKELEEILDKK